MWPKYIRSLFALTVFETIFSIIATFISNAKPNSDDRFYFDKNIPEQETVLSVSDFEMASRLVERLTDDDWDSQAIYQNDRFEGDIAMDLNITTVQLFIHGALSNKDSLYNAVRNRHQLWPNAIIPYAISSQYSPYSRSVIAASMQEYNVHTCIQWVPKSNDDINYVYIMPDRGCYSMVGRTGGRQMISLGSGCIQKGIIMHELMHAVGFFHEQSRTDRDEYVTIMWSNIQPGMQGQFEKYGHGTIQSLELDYDYASIMHYGPRAFSRNGLPTIVPKSTSATIGQRTGFSKIDAAKINKLYNCPTDRIPSSTSTVSPINTVVTPYTKTTIKKNKSTTTRLAIITATFPSTTVERCTNVRNDCSKLAEQGWCKRNPSWMEEYCAESCRMCGIRPVPSCEDLRVDCSTLVMARHCKASKTFMKTYCAKSCGFCFVPSSTESPNPNPQTPTTIGRQFLTTSLPNLLSLSTKASGRQKSTEVTTELTGSPAPTISPCRDRKHFCKDWKDAGFCKGLFLPYMLKNCRNACGLC